MDLNPLFTGASTFRPTGDGAALDLFKQANIKLVHGWLCDPNSREYGSLLLTQDYDSAMDLIAEADSLTNGQLVAASEWPGEVPNHHPEINVRLEPEAQTKVKNGVCLNAYGLDHD
jgi:MINDY deubiquitinase